MATIMEFREYDVLIIGAGASGLAAALEISKTGRKVAVIEAKNRIGGRVYSVEESGFSFELGAEFVHGNLSLTKQLLEKAGAATYPVNGSIWQYKGGQLQKQEDFIEDFDELEQKFNLLKGDKPVAAFLREDLADSSLEKLRFSLQNYVEGYYAADTNKASTKALCEELTKEEEEQYRIEGGYTVLIANLEKQCREKGVQFFLSQPVLQLHWQRNRVVAITDKESFRGNKVLITVPVGVLQKEAITFFPALPEVKKAVEGLGFGHVVKVVMQFEESFWRKKAHTRGHDLSGVGFLFSEEKIPTWWSHYPKETPVLTGWLGGPSAEAAQFLSKEEVIEKAVSSLSHLFGLDVFWLQQELKTSHYYNWSADGHFCGAYSYEVVEGGEKMKAMQQPVEQTLFFAGEGLHSGPEIGTVEGALQSGRSAALRLINSFSF